MPGIELAGYWGTHLTSTEGGLLQLQALSLDSNIEIIELHFEGSPTGIFLYDDGTGGDFFPGDGLFGLEIPLMEGNPPMAVIFELLATDEDKFNSFPWPYLTVQ